MPYAGLVRVPLHGPASYIRSPDASCHVLGIADNGTVFVQCATNDEERGYIWLPQQTTLLSLQPAIGHDRATISEFSNSGAVIGTTIDRRGNGYPALWRNPLDRPTELKLGLLGTESEGCVAVELEDENTTAPAVVGTCQDKNDLKRVPVVWRRDSLLATYQAHRLRQPGDGSTQCLPHLFSDKRVVGSCVKLDGSTIAFWPSDTASPQLLQNAIPGGEPLWSGAIDVANDRSILGSAVAPSHGERPLIWRPEANDFTLYREPVNPDHPEYNILPRRYSRDGLYILGETIIPQTGQQANLVSLFRLNTSTGRREDLGSPPGYHDVAIGSFSRSGCYATLSATDQLSNNHDFRVRICP